MITETLYYGMKVVHKETGRTAKITNIGIFVKENDFRPDWVESVEYRMDDKDDARFIRPVDSFRANFEIKKEGE